MRYTREFINGLSKEAQLELLKKDGLLIQLIDNQTEELCIAAMNQNGEALRWIENESLSLLLQTILKWGELALKFIASEKEKALPKFFDSVLAEDKIPIIKGWLYDNDRFRKKITAYSDLSGKELNALCEVVVKKYSDILTDESIGIKEKLKRIEQIINEEKTDLLLKELVREVLYRQFRVYGIISLISMDKRKNFGPRERGNVYMDLSRNILDIPNVQDIDVMLYLQFKELLSHYDKLNEKKSGEEYLMLIKDLPIEFFEKILCEDEIYEVIAFLETDGFRNAVDDNCCPKFIFGKKEEKIINDRKVIIYSDEYCRSPQYAGNVAWASENYIGIRRESLDRDYHYEWESFYKTRVSMSSLDETQINTAIYHGIKRKVLEFYHAYNSNEVRRVKKLLLKEREERIIEHEFAHQDIDVAISKNQKFICDAFYNEYNVVYTLREVEADWARVIPWFISTAKEKGVEAGTRIIWRYFANYFWIDDDDRDYYALFTKIKIGLLLPFVGSDCAVNFTVLAEKKDEIFEKLQKKMKRVITRLRRIIKTSKYQIKNFFFDYHQLEDEFYVIFQKDKPAYSKQDLKNEWKYWEAVVRMLKNFSVEGRREMEKILTEEAAGLEAFVLESAGAEQGITLLDYIYKRFSEMGVYNLKNSKDYSASNVQELIPKMETEPSFAQYPSFWETTGLIPIRETDIPEKIVASLTAKKRKE